MQCTAKVDRGVLDCIDTVQLNPSRKSVLRSELLQDESSNPGSSLVDSQDRRSVLV